MNKNCKTLQETFGKDYVAFIQFLRKKNEKTLNIFKKRYGENLDTYIEGANLTKAEKAVIDNIKQKFKKKLNPAKQSSKKNSIIPISPAPKEYGFNDIKISVPMNRVRKFRKAVYDIYKTNIEELFKGNIVILNYLLKIEMNSLLDKKSTKDVLTFLKNVIASMLPNADIIFKDIPLCFELQRLGFNNQKLNMFVLDKMSPFSCAAIYKRFGKSLSEMKPIDEREEAELYDIILPLYLTRLKKEYKRIEKLKLKNLVGNNMIVFLEFLSNESERTIKTFKKVFGENCSDYDFEAEIDRLEEGIINSTIERYKDTMKDTTSEEVESEPTKVVEVGDSVKLIIITPDGTKREKYGILVYPKGLCVSTRFEKIVTLDSIGVKIISRPVGTVTNALINGIYCKVVISSILPRMKINSSDLIESIVDKEKKEEVVKSKDKS